MKEKIKKEYLRRTKKQLEIKTIEQKPYQRNKYIGCFPRKIFGIILEVDQRRKLMTMHKVLHHRDNVDRLYVSRKEGRRGLVRIEDSVDASIQRLEDYIKKHGEGLITTPPQKKRYNKHEFTERQ